MYECMYCGVDLNEKEWISEFSGSKHYKVTECTCGKIHYLTFYDGSRFTPFIIFSPLNADSLTPAYVKRSRLVHDVAVSPSHVPPSNRTHFSVL